MRSRDLPWSRTFHLTAPAGVTWTPYDDHIAYAADLAESSFHHRLLLDRPPDDLTAWKARWHELNGGKGVGTPMFAWETRTPVPTPEGADHALWCLMLDRAVDPIDPHPDVRALTRDDLEAMVPLFAVDSDGRPTSDTWARWMLGGVLTRIEQAELGCGGVLWGRFDGDVLVSMASILWDRREARFHTVVTREPHRRRGLARDLVLRCVQTYQEESFGIAYIAATAESPAEQLYRALGFRRTTAVTLVTFQD